MKSSPPKYAQRLLRWFCDDQWIKEILGDLDEEYQDNIKVKSRFKAKLIYYYEVILFMRPHIWKRSSETQNTPLMLRNYIKSAYRNLLKNKVYGAINISGLSVGIACCLLISLYVYDETSYDKFFDDSDRIYRVALERKYPTNTRFFGSSPVNLAPTILDNYPEVEEAGRLHRLFFQNQVTVDFGDRSFIEENYLFADNNFFKVFSFDFIEGDPETALENPTNIVITESVARKYFGKEPALNKTFGSDTTRYQITGVVKDVPSNSHLQFDLLGSIHDLPFLEQAAENNSWINPWLFTYIKLNEGFTPEEFEAKLPEMVNSYGLASILSQLQLSPDDYPNSGHDFKYFLQPIEDIHLHSNLDVEVRANSNVMYVYLLSAVVLFILLISCINFINLATARSAERAKEVGVRKVMGSSKSLLVKQFLTESTMIATFGMLIALALVGALLPGFNSLVEKELNLEILANPLVIAGLVTFTLSIGVLAGLYPALVISSINSALVLKGKYKTSNKGVWLRNFLIVFQFFISISMISGTLLLGDQMNYIQNKNLGFEKSNILVIEQTQVLGDQFEAFKNEIDQINGVESIAASFAVPGDFLGNSILAPDDPEKSQIRTYINTVDDDYLSTLKMEVTSGRGFSRDFNDSLNILINETAARELGYEDPIGHWLLNPNPGPNQADGFTIIGVVEDFHHHSLHMKIPSMVLYNIYNVQLFSPGRITVRTSGHNSLSILQQIEEKWEGIENDQPFTYSFLDESLDNLYQADRQTNRIFSLFTVVAIIMACVGLFGLAAYVTQQRTKEIGIRKVLGATVPNIILLLSRDFTKLIGIAFVISVPLVYMGMTRWLENFAYRTGIDVFTLLGAGFLTLILAWLTISYYSIKIAVLNPVNSLRSE